ncbi:putative amino acid transporter, transmembrane domain-containing protein [Rosa chinensis]|uniref:Putative amino acid transporter, transmembrane domain-containing protein n=1 Tax=Rosa chinensis TaxID=74649 RepID=A0A2P6PTD1_ROSCH|nr:amino acid transporter AVT3B [Rosa chinensis]PRQ25190.1 putative amino acid transporter, transmembrane domain-containing protein [Rosa chinensis]
MGFEKEATSSSSRLRSPPATEETPLIGAPKPLSSQAKTFANVFIAIVGAGVLGMPYSFKRTGWIMSLLTLFFVAFLTHHCMMLLVYTRRKLESPDAPTKIASFGDLGFRVCGSAGRLVVDVLIILAQAGFCVGYLLFIGNTLAHLINPPTSTDLSPNIMGLAPKSFYIWGCFPFQLGLNSIKTLTHLAPLSIFADVVDLGAMGVVIIEDVLIMIKGVDFSSLKTFGDVSLFFYALGVSVYSFEGVGMVLPLESEAKDKDKFGRVLAFTMVFIALMYGSFGAFGYFAFGEHTRDLITANLGKGVISTLVKLGLVINLFFTLPIMMNPVYEIVERRLWGGRYCLWLRWLLVLAVSLVALLVPNFADFMALVGSGVCCVLGFVVPTLFHLMVFKGEMGWKQWLSDVSILAIGITLGISGTWFALQEIFAAKDV